MKKTSETILFFGNERLATGITTDAPTLRSLIENDYDVKAVVSNFNPAASRDARDLEIASVAKAHNIPLLLPANLKDIKDQLANYGAIIGVLAAYGKIVPQEIIDLFPHGIINIHPSLLPLHRGSTPIESAILHGDTKTGVSIMQLAKTMDAGPVFGQSEIVLSGKETKQALADKLLDIGQAMVIELLPDILSGNIVSLPQDDSRATYDQLISKADGLIDWNKPAEVLEREVRAFADWPKSRTTLAGKEVVVTKAHATPSQSVNTSPGDVNTSKDGAITVATGDGTLCIDSLKPAGKSEMTAKAFIAGYGQRL